MSRELGFPVFYAASPGEELGHATLLAQQEVPQLSTAELSSWDFYASSCSRLSET